MSPLEDLEKNGVSTTCHLDAGKFMRVADSSSTHYAAVANFVPAEKALDVHDLVFLNGGTGLIPRAPPT